MSKARIASLFYVVNIVTGAFAWYFASRKLTASADVAGNVAAASYLVVTLLFFEIFKPVNRSLSLLAAFFSIVGCAKGGLAFFGVYCLLIGYLIFKSHFLPRFLGVLLAIGGVGWITFLSPQLASALAPYNMLPGVVAEIALTLWLLVMGVDAQRWKEAHDVSLTALGTSH
jgi:hypothetical protein